MWPKRGSIQTAWCRSGGRAEGDRGRVPRRAEQGPRTFRRAQRRGSRPPAPAAQGSVRARSCGVGLYPSPGARQSPGRPPVRPNHAGRSNRTTGDLLRGAGGAGRGGRRGAICPRDPRRPRPARFLPHVGVVVWPGRVVPDRAAEDDSSSRGAASPADAAGPRRRRGRRVVVLLVVVCLFGACDLALTLTARRLLHFREANPLAREFLGSEAGLVAFKLALTAAATIVLLKYRHRRVTEMGCWVLLLAYGALMIVWAFFLLAA